METLRFVDQEQRRFYYQMLTKYRKFSKGPDSLNRIVFHVHFIDGLPGRHMVPGEGVLPMSSYWDELVVVLKSLEKAFKSLYEIYLNNFLNWWIMHL